MTIRTKAWYRVASTRQYCKVQRIPSTTNPRISVPEANQNTRGFEAALEWYTPVDEALTTWEKRVMILELRKALSLLREPGREDSRAIARIKRVAATLPVSAASRDGEFTMPV